MGPRATRRPRSESYLVLRGGGFSMSRRSPNAVTEVVAAGTFGPNEPVAAQIESVVTSIRGAAARGERVTLVLCDVWSRTQLLSIPPATPAVARQVLGNQLGAESLFCATEVGQTREGNAVLAAHLVMSCVESEVNDLVRALRACSVHVTRVAMFDGVLLRFGQGHVSAQATGLHMAVVVEPAWLHIACYDAGRPVFIRHVETLADLAADTRAAAVVAEVQRTVLVVRGRLRSPELERVSVLDPMGLVDRAGVEEGGAQIGAPFTFGEMAVEHIGENRAVGDAIRVAAVSAVGSCDLHTLLVSPSALREGAHRLRVAAAIVFMVLCLGGATVFEHHRRSAGAGAVKPAIAVDEGDRSLVALMEEARGTLAAFDGAFGALAAHVDARPRMSGIIDDLASEIPATFVVEALSVDRAVDESGQLRPGFAVRIDGLARGSLGESRAGIRALHDKLSRLAQVSNLVEAPFDTASLGKDSAAPGRELTRFAFSFQWGSGS
jgi:hypothetical protein